MIRFHAFHTLQRCCKMVKGTALLIHTSIQQVEPHVQDHSYLEDAGALLHGKSISRTTSIQELVACGRPEQALDHVDELQRDGKTIYTNRQTLLALLKACGRLKCIVRGQELHAVLAKQGYELDCFTGCILVYMYGKCGLLRDAQHVLNKVPSKNVILWTSLVGAYADHGFSAKALDCMKQMKLEGVLPNPISFACILKACGDMRDIDECMEIHAEISKLGFDKDTFVGSALVDVYSKCTHLPEAQKVVDVLPFVDSITLTPLLMSYAECGLSKEAVNCWKTILRDTIFLDAVTLKCSLKACSSIKHLDWGREIHSEVVKRGLEVNLPICNTLVSMYAKCGSLPEAEVLFNRLPVKDVVSWNALLHGYSDHNLWPELCRCLELMRMTGVAPTAVTCVCYLKACETIKLGLEMHLESIKLGIETNKYVASALVDMYAKFGWFAEALKMFNGSSCRNTVSWTALISGYVDYNLGEEAMHLFGKMLCEGVPIDVVTFFCSLKVCGEKRALARGQELYVFLTSESLERVPCIGSILVEMYARCGVLRDAGYVFDRLLPPTVTSWTSLIVGYANNGFGQEAIASLKTMQLEGLCMNATTFACCLKVCGNVGVSCEGLKLHAKIAREGVERDALVGNALVDFYAKCGLLFEAQNVFDKLLSTSSISWTVMITAHSCQGDYFQVFGLFNKMKKQGIQPDKVTFLSLLTACSHVGLVDEGQGYFTDMCKGYDLAPSMDHINCMLDIYSRAGQLAKVSFILDRMPFQPDVSTWLTVLSGCRKWGDVNLGICALESVLMLGENHHVAVLLMVSIYMEVYT